MAKRVDAVDEKHVSTSVNRAVVVAIESVSSCDYNPESEAEALGDENLPVDDRAVLVDMDDEPEEDERVLDAYLRKTG